MEGGGEVASEKTRIYVGGLGSGVTEDDLRKTFSALGEVVAVDVVRTKGRSFAYLDFLPSSEKSLPKLFSTYNGCMWKGGKLRLEKAKEHYLLRLNREWQEDSEHTNKSSDHCDSSASENHHTLEKKPSPTDKTQIQLFFPKLGKVKSLAQVGIGKHKYSFQRIQVPSIPTHFCDCEEHSVAFSPPNKKQSSEFENVGYGINEQELNIMNSVMNKIFERANPSKQVTVKSESVNVGGVSLNSNELVADENDNEDHLTDEDDNLIINVATRNSDSMDLLGEMRTMMKTQEPVAKRPITSTEKPKSVRDSRQKKTVPPSKKRKSLHSEENDSSHILTPETSRKVHLDTPEDNKTKAESSTKQSGSNSLRSLKSTWKDLIGQKRNTSFSISNFLATVSQRKEEDIKGDDTNQHLTKKKNLVHNKKRKTEGDKTELISSVPETTSSKSHINREPTTEIGAVATKVSIPDVLASDCQQKEEEPKADNLDMPLTTRQQFSKSDVHSDAFNKTEADPKVDDVDNGNLKKLDNADSQPGNSNDLEKPSNEDLIRTARGDFWRHKSSWTQLISTTNHTSFSISQIIPNTSFEKHAQEAVDASDSQLPANKNLDDQKPVGKEVTSSPVKKNTSEKRRILSLENLESDGTCPFMRTEDSMKEWKKAKASVSSSLNKKKRSLNESA